MASVRLLHAAQTDIGIVRKRNEDYLFIDEQVGLYVVCDGVGGREGGDFASRIACEFIGARMRDQRQILEQASAAQGAFNKRQIVNLIERAMSDASAEIRAQARKHPEFSGMATTCALMLVVGQHAFVAHVGDSRVYLIRHNTVHLLTEDHSVVNDMKRRGADPDQSNLGARYKNALTRALGVLDTARVDMLDLDLLEHDRVVICSDGAYGVMPETVFQAVIQRGSTEETVNGLIESALQHGGPDNITAIVVDVAQEAGTDRAAQVRSRLEALQSVSMFRYLPYADLIRVASVAEEVSVDAGTSMLREGEVGDSLYVILTGIAEVSKMGAKIADVEPGGHFGEMSLIERAPRSADIVAKTQLTALVIHRESFFSLLREEVTAVKLLWGMVRMLNARLVETNNELTALRFIKDDTDEI